MARNWINLAGQCQRSTQAGSQVSLFANAVTGSLRQYLPGSNPLAQQEGLRFKQADQTYLAVSGTPADFPHRELDFGGLIWSAYGNRLLYDFGYGEIALTAQGKPYLLNDGNTQLFDNLPLGTNTLVVEDATQTGYTNGKYQNATINSSQIYGERGTLVQASIGNLTGLHLDAQAVYGANDAELGWLRYFDRWMLPLGDGNFLVADAFAVKADRGSADVQEYWHTAVDTEAASSCSFSRQNVAMSLENTHSLRLKPECARLNRTAASTVVGRIAAASWQAGEFSIDPEIINYKTRINTTIQRQRARFKPLNPVSEDVRVFLLQAAPKAEQLQEVSLQKGDCGGNAPCFELRMNRQIQRLTFTRNNARYSLAGITVLADRDGDGTPDNEDAFPDDPNESVDTDHDGVGNNADIDDDGDRIPDVKEIEYGLNPLDASDARLDKDGDGISNVDEYLQGRNPRVDERVTALIPVIMEMLIK